VKTIATVVELPGGRLAVVSERDCEGAAARAATMVNVALAAASVLSVDFAESDPATSPEFRAIGRAAEVLCREIHAFKLRARAELARVANGGVG
jgi:hypothetical protein